MGSRNLGQVFLTIDCTVCALPGVEGPEDHLQEPQGGELLEQDQPRGVR